MTESTPKVKKEYGISLENNRSKPQYHQRQIRHQDHGLKKQTEKNPIQERPSSENARNNKGPNFISLQSTGQVCTNTPSAS